MGLFLICLTAVVLAAEPVELTVGGSPDGSVTLRATVTPEISGPVTFYSGSVPLGVATLNLGTAELRLPSLPPGRYSLTAVHKGTPSRRMNHVQRVVPSRHFGAATKVPLDGEPFAVAYNHPDFVVVSPSQDTVTVVRTGRTYRTGSRPRAAQVFDFNEDGRSDLAVANSGSDTVTILLGDGEGGFRDAIPYQAGAGPIALAVLDHNKDGHADIATANRADSTVSLLLGRGDGTFAAPTFFPLSAEPTGIAVGEFGIAVSTEDGVEVSGQRVLKGRRIRGLVAGDFNTDTVTDLIAIGDELTVLMGGNEPAGRYTIPDIVSVSWSDFDGDGFPDLFTLNELGSVGWMRGNGNGTFGPAEPVTVSGGTALLAGDWNGDRRTDLAVLGPRGLALIHGEDLTDVRIVPPTVSSEAPPVMVTSTADSGPGSLRAAVALGAIAPIQFAMSNATITLTSPITLTTGIVIDGTGQNITISGGNSTRVFVVTGSSVTVRGITIANGYAKGGDGGNGKGGGGGAAGLGGGVFMMGGIGVRFERVNFVNNRAVGGNGGSVAEGNSGIPDTANAGGGGGGLGGNGTTPSYGPIFSFRSDIGGNGGPGGVLGGVIPAGGYLDTIDTRDLIDMAASVGAAMTMVDLANSQTLTQFVFITAKAALTTAGTSKFKEIVGNFGNWLDHIDIITYPRDAGPGSGGGGMAKGVQLGGPGGFGGGGGSAYWSVMGMSQMNGTEVHHTYGGAGGFGGGQGGGRSSNGAGIGGDAYGGAIFLYSGDTVFDGCAFTNNSVQGGASGAGSFGTSANFTSTSAGPALYVHENATAAYPTLTPPSFTGNTSATDANVGGLLSQQGGTGTVYVLMPGDLGFGTLRWAVGQVAAGGTIRFSSALTGQTITLNSEIVLDKRLTLDGSGSNITISGGDRTRIFTVASNGVNLRNLTLRNGYAKGGNGGASRFGGGGGAGLGGAILIQSGELGLINVVLMNNRAQGGNGGGGSAVNLGGAGGGGLAGNGADANATLTSGASGGSGGPAGGAPGAGGPFPANVDTARLAAQNGGDGGFGAGGGGGASGLATAVSITWGGTWTVKVGGNGGKGGVGGGGGGAGYEVCVTNTFPSYGCGLQPNNAKGGDGGLGGGGGAGYIGGSSVFGGTGGSSANYAVGGGGAGLGGAIFMSAGTLDLDSVTFSGNSATGGSGAQRGQGKGGALFYGGGTIRWNSPATFTSNWAQDGTTNPTDNGNIWGTTVNGAPAVFNITSAIVATGLAQVFASAPAGSTIQFDPALNGTSIPIPAEITINKDVTVDGALGGAKNIALAAGTGTPSNRIFCITAGNVAIRNLTFSGASGQAAAGSACAGTNNGGAIQIRGGNVVISNSAFVNNGKGVPQKGAAIYLTGGNLTLYSSRFGNNTVSNASVAGSNLAAVGGMVTYGSPSAFEAAPGHNPTTTEIPSGLLTTLGGVFLTVTSTAATGPGSLAEAVSTAPAGSTILFGVPAGSTIATADELFIAGDLTIDGGANNITISGGNDHRIFFVHAGRTNLKNLTLTGGLAKGGDGGTAYASGTGGGGAGMGGAVFLNGGTLSVTNVLFRGNVAAGGLGGDNSSLGHSNEYLTNIATDRAGSGGGGSRVKGGDANIGGTFGAGGFGGSLVGQDGGAGGAASQAGANGGFGAGGGGGGNSGSAAGRGGNGGFGGGAGSSGAGPNGVQGTPGTFGGSASAGLGGNGAALGGALFARAGTVMLANATFSQNRAETYGVSRCITDICGGRPDDYRGKGKGGAIFLNDGVTATSLGAVTFVSGGIDANSALDAAHTATDNNNVYGNLPVPTTLTMSGASIETQIGRPFPVRTLTVKDQFGQPMLNIPVTVTFPGSGASIAGPPVVVYTTNAAGTISITVTANEITGSYTARASVGPLQTPDALYTNYPPRSVDSVAVVAGSPQSTATGAAFVTPLKALAKDFQGNPIPYTDVKFFCCWLKVWDGRVSAAGAKFPGNASMVTVRTGADGTATAPTLTANLITGSYVAYVDGGTASGTTPSGTPLLLTNVSAPAAAITAAEGTPQSAVYGTEFGTRLKALVSDANGVPVPNVTVTFGAPDPNSNPGISGTFTGGSNTATAVTDPFGIATAPAFTANTRTGSYVVAAVAAGVATATSFSLTNLPSASAAIEVVSGTPQTATIGALFGGELKAKVKDIAGNAVPNATVTFTTPDPTAASAVFSNNSQTIQATTNEAGIASVPVTANSKAGTYTVTASVSGAVTNATYSLTNTASNAAVMSIVSGNNQSNQIFRTFGSQMVAKVSDSGGNPVSGVNVVFSAPASGASGTFPGGLTTLTVATDNNGRAVTLFTANGTAGSYTVSAVVPGLTSPVAFNFTNQVGGAASATVVSGSGQIAAQNTAFALPLKVLVKDAGGNPVPNWDITFSAPGNGAGGRFAPSNTTAVTVKTDSQGVATSTVFTSNNVAGTYEVITYEFGGQVVFTMTNLPGPPAFVSVVSGSAQSATVNTGYAGTLKALVRDSAGVAISGATVTFTAPASGPSVSFPGGLRVVSATTDANGEATSPVLTANSVAGGFAVVASAASGTMASFALTNLGGTAASISVYTGSGQSAPLSANFGAPLAAIVKDAAGNPVPAGTSVTFTAPSSGASGTFANGQTTYTTTTAATGIATSTTFKANSTIGSYNVSASAAGVGTPTTFSLTNTASAVLTLATSGGTPQTTVVNTAFGSALVAVITATGSNSGVSVTFTLPNSGASATFAGGALTATVQTVNGFATSPILTANSTSGTFTATASVNALTASYTLTNTLLTVGTNTITLPGSSGNSQVLLGTGGTNAAWTASSNVSWIQITTPSGNGGAAVKFSYSANPSALLRTGTITAGGKTVTVTQVGNNYVQVRTANRLVSGLTNVYQAAPDSAGNLYFGGTTVPFPSGGGFNGTGRFYQWAASNQQITPLVSTGLSLITATAVDPQGLVYFSDGFNSKVRKWDPTTQQASIVSDVATGGLGQPSGVAADSAGYIYMTDQSAGRAARLGGYNKSIALEPLEITSFNAADALGRHYVTKTRASITQLDPAGNVLGTIPTDQPLGVAVDGQGKVTYSDWLSEQVYQYDPLTQTTTILLNSTSGLYALQGVSVDSRGDVYVADLGDPNVIDQTGTIWKITTAYFAPSATTLNVSSMAATNTLAYGLYPANTPVTATSDSDWLTISGTSNGAIQFTTTTNGTGSARSATITVFDQTITVNQGTNSVAKQAGDNQSANAGSAFATALQVKVTNSAGAAVASTPVTFAVMAGATGASATFSGSATVNTNASGIATASTLTANSTAGAFTVTATSNGVTAIFSLTNGPAGAASVTATAGTPQSRAINLAFATQFQVIVKDANGNGKSGVNVTFAAPASGASGKFTGNLTSAVVATDSTGTATAPVFTANGTTGTYNVTASVSGVGTPATFSLTNLAAVAETITVVSGSGQSTGIGQAFANPLKVQVKDILGNPISGMTVGFYSPGSGAGAAFPNGNSAVTDGSGVATSPIINANSIVGSYSITASTATSTASASFSMSNTPGAPASISINGSSSPSARVLESFGSLSVKVRDFGGNEVPGVTVTFAAPATGASGTFASGNSAVTDSSGNAVTSAFTANGVIGTYALTATAAGLAAPATYTMKNNVGIPASVTVLAGNPQSATVGTAFGSFIRVLLLDAAGNPVPAQTLTFRSPTNNGANATALFNGSTSHSVQTGLSTSATPGVATTAVPVANNKAGTYTITVGLGASWQTNFTFTNLAGAANAIAATAGGGQTATINTAFATALKATVTDPSNNPVPGVTVTFAAPATGASGSFSGGTTAVTDASGVATATTFTANGTAGSYSVTASVSGVATPASFSLTNTAGAAAAVTAVAGTPQSATVGTAFGSQLQAKVTDAGGNPLAGVTVTFAAPATGASGSFTGGNTAVTNASGIATSNAFTANTAAGSYTVTASSTGATSAGFSMTNAAGAGAGVTAVAGTPHSTAVLTAFATQLQAIVKDQHGNGVSGVTVTFTAPESGASGTFAGAGRTATATTNASGLATAPVLTANGATGSYQVVASIVGVVATASFSLTNTVGAPATITATSGSGQSATVLTAFGAPLVATVRDTGGNPVPNVTVTFSLPGSGAGAAFGGSNVATTNASGVATSPALTANATAGSYSATAAVAGGSVTPATFSLTNLPLIPVTVSTNVAGLAFVVDGVTYTSATTFEWPIGSAHQVGTASTPMNAAGTAQYAFSNWNDGGAIGHTYTVPASGPVALTANFNATAFLLQVGASPAAAGVVKNGSGVAYPSLPQFIAAGSTVTLNASANAGYAFSQYTFPITDSALDKATATNPLTVTMNGPKSILANYTVGTPVFGVTVVSKSATAGQDTWTVRVTNSGKGTATAAAITAITITPATTIATPRPISLGTIAPGGSTTASFTFTLPATTFSIAITVSDGATTKTVTFSNLRI